MKLLGKLICKLKGKHAYGKPIDAANGRTKTCKRCGYCVEVKRRVKRD